MTAPSEAVKKIKNNTGKNACATWNLVAQAFLPVWILDRLPL